MGNNMKLKQEETVNILRVEGIMAQGYGLNPKIVMRDKRLSPEAKCIYSYIASFAGAGSQAFPSREVILDELQMSKDRYYRHLNLLIEADYIKIDQVRDESGYFKRNIYTIVTNPDPEVKKEEVQKNGQQKRKTAGKKQVAARNPKKLQSKSPCIKAEQKAAAIKTSLSELRDRLQIDELKETEPENSKLIEEIFLAVEDMEMSEQISIAGSIKNKDAIQSLLNHLTSENIRVVIKTLINNKKTLTNRKKYIQTCLANSLFDINKQNDDVQEYLKQRNQEEEEERIAAEKRAENKRKLDKLYDEYPELKKIDSELVKITKEKATAILKHSDNDIEQLNRKTEELEKQREKIITANSLDVYPQFYYVPKTVSSF